MTLIAVAQTNSSDIIKENIALAVSLVKQAKQANASAICLPECFGLMQTSRKQLRQSAEILGEGIIQKSMSDAARTNGITIFAGSLPIVSKDPARVYNCSMVFSSEGECIAQYSKIHLFDVTLDSGEQYLESAYTMPGSELVHLDSVIGPVGLSVCYDIRFPEVYRQLVECGAMILLVPSAFSVTTGPVHWQTLLQARAIENFSYVIAAAQWGKHPSGRSTYGHSMVIDPWGKVIAEKKEGTGLLMAEIDLNDVINARRQMPSLNHRRQFTLK